MTTLNTVNLDNLKSLIKPIFFDKNAAMQALFEDGVPFTSIDNMYNLIGTDLVYIVTKEIKIEKINVYLVEYPAIVSGGIYQDSKTLLDLINDGFVNDETTLIKKLWNEISAFPKKDNFELSGKHRTLINYLVANPDMTIAEFIEGKDSLIGDKGNYHLDIIKFVKFFQSMKKKDIDNLLND